MASEDDDEPTTGHEWMTEAMVLMNSAMADCIWAIRTDPAYPRVMRSNAEKAQAHLVEAQACLVRARDNYEAEQEATERTRDDDQG